MEKPVIQEIVVVEGRDDTRRLQEVLTVDTIETNGSAIDQTVLDQIKAAQATRGVIVLTDPDTPGQKIRQTILQAVPNVKQAFLRQGQAQPEKHKSSLGVEHASNKAILAALSHAHTTTTTAPVQITQADLQAAKLTFGPDAKWRRLQLGNILQIGYANGKQLYKRLQAFQISPAAFQAAVAKVDQLAQHQEEK